MRLLFVLLVVVSANLARSDEMTMLNGEKVTGELIMISNESVVFNSANFGELSVSREEVKSLSTDGLVRIAHIDGQELVGVINSISDQGIQFDVRGREFELKWDEIEGINLPIPAATPTVWKGALSSSLGLVNSNRNAQNFNLDFDIIRERDTDRLKAKAAYAFSNQSVSGGGSETTVDTWFTRGEYNAIVSEKFFWYGSTRFDRDRVSDLDLRSVFGAGGGYTLWNNQNSSFRTTFGLSLLNESFTGGQSNSNITLQIGTGFHHVFRSWLTILHDMSYYPNPSNVSDFFLSSELILRSALASDMFAEFKFVFDYDATPAPGAQLANYRYTMGVGMRF